VGRLAVYFLTTVRVYFGGELARGQRVFSKAEIYLFLSVGRVSRLFIYNGGMYFPAACGNMFTVFGALFFDVNVLETFVEDNLKLICVVMSGLLVTRTMVSKLILAVSRYHQTLEILEL
jgi:hypothetical protein